MKHLKLFSALLLTAFLSIGQMWADVLPTEDFEKQTAGSTYNSQLTYNASASNAGIGWYVEHGTVSTNSKLSGDKSMQMRGYYAKSSAASAWNGALPYLQSTTAVTGLQSISLKIAAAATFKIDFLYSTDDGDTWSAMKTNEETPVDATNQSFTTSASTVTYNIPSSSSSADYLIKIVANSSSTHTANPGSNGNLVIRVDDIVFTYAASSNPTLYFKQGENDITEIDLGNVGKSFAKSTTFSLSGENLTKDADLTLAASAGFTVSPTSIKVSAAGDLAAQTITVSKNTTTVGSITDGTLTISSDDFDDPYELTLKMDVKAPTFSVKTGDLAFGTVLQYVDHPTKTITLKGQYVKDQVAVGTASAVYSAVPTRIDPDANGEFEEEVTVTAATEWSGALNSYLTIQSTTSEFADLDEFEAITMTVTPRYEIAVSKTGNGTVTWTVEDDNAASPQYALAGKTVTVGAAAGDGYEFTSLALSENVTEKEIVDDVAVFTMPASDVTITAVFTESEDPYLNVSKSEIDFDEISYKGALDAESFTIEGANLTGDKVTIALVGNGETDEEKAANAAAFSINENELAITDGSVSETTITVTPRRDVCGSFSAKLVISTTGISPDKEVALSLTVNKLAANLAWSADETTAIIGEEKDDYPTLTNPRKLPVVYSSLYEDVATVNTTTGAITELKKAGETLIIANFAGNDTVAGITEDDLYYTLTVQEKKTANWWVNGTKVDSQTDLAGTDLKTFPSDFSDFTDCADLTFQGWLTAPLAEASATAPVGLITETEGLTMPEDGVNYYAVFATVENTGSLEEKSVSTTMSAYVTANSCSVGGGNSPTLYTSLTLDDNITLSTTGSANCGAFYDNSGTKDWRLYQAQSGNAIVTVTNGYELDSVTFTYNTKNSGTLVLSSTTIASGTRVHVSGTSATFTVGNTGNATNGQAQITAVKVHYFKDTRSTTVKDYVTTCPHCDNEVAFTKAGQENGNTFELQIGGVAKESIKTCEAAVTVNVVEHLATGYELSNVAISELDGASIDGKVITLAQNTTGDLTVTATFSKINYEVALLQTGDASATLTGAKDDAHYGDEITVTASAVDGFYFLGWEATGVTLTDASTLSQTFDMPNNNVSLTAKYTKILTVAEAVALIKEESTASNQVVEGYISSVGSYNSSYHSITYYIKDVDANGFLSDDNVIKVYSGKGLNNADFSSEDDIEVGAKVRIYGNLLYYNPDYEINYNNYLLSYDAGSYVGVDIYGDATETEYEVGDAFEFDGLSAKHTWSNGYAEAIENPTWTATPATIAASTESVSVTAKDDDNTSAPVEVEITVLTHKVIVSEVENGTVVVQKKVDEEWVNIAANEEFVKGTNLKVVATPADGYYLSALTVNDDIDILDARNFNMPAADATVAATFTAKADPDISWTNAGPINLTLGDTYSYYLPTLNNDDEWEVSYESSNTAAAEISAAGVVTIKAAGTTVISAKVAADETTKEKTVSYTLNIAEPKSYSLKNNWDGGNWTWQVTTYAGDGKWQLANVVFGGGGVNWREGDTGDGTWVAVSDEEFLGDAISAWDNVTLALNPSAGTITATLNSRASVEFGGSWTENWSDGKITAVLSSDGTYATAKKELTKDVWYDFKPVIGGHWLGCSAGATGITRSSNTASGFVTADGDNHIYFQADKTGEYQFTWYFITSTCQVTFPGDIPSALDNTADETKAVKFLENGQIFILRGDKVYTVDGQLVK